MIICVISKFTGEIFHQPSATVPVAFTIGMPTLKQSDETMGRILKKSENHDVIW